ncbi:MAG: AMP-binding protein, partial [Acidobacteriaceae bacterium]
MGRCSITEYLDGFARRGSEIAFVHKRGYRTLRWSYGRIAELAFQFARELEERGIQKGDRVLLWGDNCGEWAACLWGCALRGVAGVPIDRISNRDFAQRVFAEVDGRLIVVAAALMPEVSFTQSVIEMEQLRELLARHSPLPYTAIASEPGDTVEIVFTSGTTSEPKGVVISQRNILASLIPLEEEIGKYLKYERFFHPLRFLCLLPLSHVFGQFISIFIPQLLGGAVYFEASLNPSDILATIKRERISVCAAVPRSIDSLREKIEREGGDSLAARLEEMGEVHFLRRWWRFRRIHRQFGWKFWAFISGGAALSADTEEFWRRLGYVVIQGYGMTESTSLISLNHPFKLGRGSIGKTLPGREIKLDSSGEILVRGDNIASAYWTGRRLQPVTGEEGWLRTGDLGALDRDGNLYFKGRKKDVIVTADGLKIYPEDLEAALRRQPEIRDCAVVGLKQGGNAVPAAAIIAQDRQAPEGDMEEAVRRANELLADFQKIRRWMIWREDDFPRTSTQKPRTNLIQQAVSARFGAEAVDGASAAGGGGALAQLIARTTRQRGAVSPESRLEEDLNLSSIDRVDLMSAIEDRYLMDVDEIRFAKAKTVGDLEGLLREHAAAAGGARYPYPRWPMRWPWPWVRAGVYYLLTWPATLLLGRPRVVGRELLRGVKGPALIICNHVTAIDIGFLMYALPARLRTRLAVAMSGELLRGMRYPAAALPWWRRVFEKLQYALV